MGLFDGFRNALAFLRGQKEGQRRAEQTEANWARLVQNVAESDRDPETVHALFLGGMKAFHAQHVELFQILGAKKGEIDEHWKEISVVFAKRYRSEILLRLYPANESALPSEAHLAAIIVNIDAAVSEFMGRIHSDQDKALDKAVKGIREAEEAGRLGRDPRSDAEIKESIRVMWDAK